MVSTLKAWKKKPFLILVLLIVAGLVLLLLFFHFHKTSYKKPAGTANSAVAKPKPAAVRSYKVGDSQKYGLLGIKLDNIYTLPITQSAIGAEINPTDFLFAVQITVTNSGTQSVQETPNSGIAPLSTIYTSDTKYVRPFLSHGANFSQCAYRFGYDSPQYIASGEAQTGCIIFDIPRNVFVDTYFYGDLKWFL